MKNSTKNIISEIIDRDDCPFTEFEVHGFFTGLILSFYDTKAIEDKIIKFLDISKNSLSDAHELTRHIKEELTLDSFYIFNKNEEDFDKRATVMSEWAYYFLIAFQDNNSTELLNPETQEIIDILDEISQISQKYKMNEEKDITKESLDDIDDFVVKSVLYLSNKNDQ